MHEDLKALVEELTRRALDPTDDRVECSRGDAAHGTVITARGLVRRDATRFSMPCEVRLQPAPEARAEGDDEATESADVGFETIGSVEGVASSTSKDWYGTEMTRDALESMADQFRGDPGVPLLPGHGSWLSVHEWDSVIGQSVDATVERADVERPADPAEQGYLLTVVSALYGVDKARELRDRLGAKQPIGQSIGGWFTALQLIYDDEDELDRVLVLDVELDHLAVTRAPANPDCDGLVNLRSACQGIARSMHLPVPAEEPAAEPAVDVDTEPATVQTPEARAAEPDCDDHPEPDPDSKDNRSGVSPGTESLEDLDSEVPPGEDAPQVALSIDEHPSPPDVEEPEMTPEEIAALVARSVTDALTAALPGAIEGAVAPLQEEVRSLRAATPASEPAPEPEPEVSPEIVALRAQIERQNAAIARLAEAPQRRGLHSATRVPVVDSGAGAEASFRSLVSECQEQGQGTALAALVERHVTVLAEEDGPANVNGAGSIRNLQRILCAGLRAAQADGLISAPSFAANWS